MEQTLIQSEPIHKTEKNWHKIAKEGGFYAVLFLITLFAYLTVKPLITEQSVGFVAQTLMICALIVCVGVLVYLGATKRLTARRIIVIMLIMGFILRLGYILYTAGKVRQMDTYNNKSDHEAYAWSIYAYEKLPTTNKYQFYHPPFNAFIQAGFMKFMSALGKIFSWDESFFVKFSYMVPSKNFPYLTAERYFLYSSCQILGVMYSTITAVVLLKTVGLFSFSNKTKVFLAAFVIFYPRQIQFAGQLNNDCLSYLLGTLALYFALKWWKGGKRLPYILLCALALGLGMMTKLSSATVALPIAGIFIYEFFVTLRKKTDSLVWWKLFLQYGAFLAICAPLGLWFQFYAKARFNQEFGYVFDNLVKSLYTGDESFFDRFFIPRDLSEIFGRLYCQTHNGSYNIFNFMLRSSIFAEFSYQKGDMFAAVAVIFAYLSAIALFVGLIWSFVLWSKKAKKNNFKEALAKLLSGKDFLFIFLLVQSQALSQIYFNIKMPYSCTMDFRYIMPMILGMALMLGYVQKTLVTEGGRASKAFSRILPLTVAAFLASSALFYCVCA